MGCWHLVTLHVIVYRVYIHTLLSLIGVMNFRTLTELWHRSREANRKYRDVSVSRRLSTLRYLNSTALYSHSIGMSMFEVTFSLFFIIIQSARNTLDSVSRSQSDFDQVIYNYHWEFSINEKVIPKLTSPISYEVHVIAIR